MLNVSLSVLALLPKISLAQKMKMKIVLTKELEDYVKAKVRSGRNTDESEVVREVVRDRENSEGESPALEAALLEGVRDRHQPYTKSVLNRIRKNARAAW